MVHDKTVVLVKKIVSWIFVKLKSHVSTSESGPYPVSPTILSLRDLHDDLVDNFGDFLT